MEEKTPTMPSVVFLKYLKITGEGVDSQGKFAYATCDVSCKIKCDTEKPLQNTLCPTTLARKGGVGGGVGNATPPPAQKKWVLFGVVGGIMPI